MKIARMMREWTCIEWLLLLLGVAFSMTQLVLSWDKPILDEYAFRQTQTAISVYWMMKGGAWLAYPTPVLGAPWAIPFEFPLYQWIVSIVAEYLPFLTLDQAGRVVSEIFFLICLWPLWRITSYNSKGRSLFMICGALLLFSPIYAFWSRSFMMESAALFFSIWFVAALVDFREKPTTLGFIEMSGAGALAALIKITTFVGFSFAGAFIVLWGIYAHRKDFCRARSLLSLAAIAASVALSIVVLMAWVHFSDALKSENIFGKMFTSEALRTWNFGTFKQRISNGLWQVVFQRAPDEAVGAWWAPALFLIYAVIKLSKRNLLIYLGLLLLYVLPFFVFTNLHLVHHYYQFANSIFLVLALGFGISTIAAKQPRLGMLLLVCFLSLEVYGYSKYFYTDMMQPNRELQSLLATYVRSHVDQDQMIVGFGLTWSSEVPYYGERRALLIPDSAAPAALEEISASITTYTDDLKIGAVIVCPNAFSTNSLTAEPYQKLLAVLTRNTMPKIVGDCRVYQ